MYRLALLLCAVFCTGCASSSSSLIQVQPRGDSSAWVRLCDRGQLSGKGKHGQDIAKSVETCTTLTEQIHPDTGAVMVSVALQQARLGGREKQTLTVTVPNGVAIEPGAAITAFPADLWLKVQRHEKLDNNDQISLKARTVRLAFKHCAETGCIAEAEAAPQIVDLLKSNAGLMVHTMRLPRSGLPAGAAHRVRPGPGGTAHRLQEVQGRPRAADEADRRAADGGAVADGWGGALRRSSPVN